MLVLHPSSVCDICMDAYVSDKAPHAVPCGHIFCKNCIRAFQSPNCPICRSWLNPDRVVKLHVDRIAESNEPDQYRQLYNEQGETSDYQVPAYEREASDYQVALADEEEISDYQVAMLGYEEEISDYLAAMLVNERETSDDEYESENESETSDDEYEAESLDYEYDTETSDYENYNHYSLTRCDDGVYRLVRVEW